MATRKLDGELRVLLVEDDPAIAQMYKLGFESEGYIVRSAADGQTGLSMAREFAPDVIFLDILLPGMNGLALLDQMRADERTRNIPTLILTNQDDPQTEQRGLQLGAREFLSKSKTAPVDLARWVKRTRGGDARRSES